MKCRKCGDKAVISMRQHKLALCKEDFLQWIPQQTERFIQQYRMFDRNDRVLVAVSGGKDSLSLWDVLRRLDYQADGLFLGLGIDEGSGYSRQSRQYCMDFAEKRGLELITVDVEAREGATISRAAQATQRGRGKPCSVCGLSKRYLMNQIARQAGYDVLVTGHNLDDEAAVLFGNTLNWATGYLVRQGPVLEERSSLVRKAKPFCRLYERETAAYAILRDIDYIYEECPYAVGAKSIYYKEVLNQIEARRPGAKLSFYLSFLRAKEQGLLVGDPDKENPEESLHPCELCGEPTTAPGQCAYCRTWERTRASLLV